MEKWITSGKPSGFSTDSIYYVYETQDDSSVCKVFSTETLQIGSGSYYGVVENVCTKELLYCLENCGGFSELTLEDYVFHPEDSEILFPLFHRSSKICFTRCGFSEDTEKSQNTFWLCSPDSKIQELCLQVCVLIPTFFRYLSNFISSSQTLTKLLLSHYKLTESDIKYLCGGLQHPGCALQELGINNCDLRASSCEELGSSLKTNRSLLKLDLALNPLEDLGVKFLCDGLRYPGCTVQNFRMDYSSVTSACCDDFRSVLISNRSLTTLFLMDEALQDTGAKLLCEGLKHPDCTLQELSIHESSLASSCCEHFCSVLLTNRNLRILDLTYNNLEDSGIKILCEALRSLDCTLQELILSHCKLTFSSCDDLRSVITTSRSLTKLDLTWNNLEDSGVDILCEGLKDQSCILKELGLYGCDLTSSSYEYLQSVLVVTRSLTKLNLDRNQIEDSGVKVLCETLKDPRCVLQTLRVGYCNLNSTSCEEFHDVLKKSKTLKVLDVSINVDEDQPQVEVDAMCKRLEHPASRLWKNVPEEQKTLELVLGNDLPDVFTSFCRTQDGTYVYFTYTKGN